MTNTLLLRDAADEALRVRWGRMRSYKRNRSQVGIAVEYLESIGCKYVADVSPKHISQLADWSLSSGASVATLNLRMGCLSALGVTAKFYPPTRQRKWFLSPQEEERFNALNLPPPLPGFVLWTVATGLRIEESLALRWRDVDLNAGTVSVSGTKTDMAQALLPLSEEAVSALGAVGLPGDLVFPHSYYTMRQHWNRARRALGLQAVPTATLKSLRRSFARRAHLKGMPADVLRQYLRHGDISTTMGYLWLVGGYSQDEMRKYL